MSKQTKFLSMDNIRQMADKIYTEYRRAGGGQAVDFIREKINVLMRNWNKLDYIDSYESLVDDEEEEMEKINQDFYEQYARHFVPDDRLKVTKFETPNDYREYDVPRAAAPTISNAVYRRENAFPIDRRIARPYERDSEFRGRSLGLKNRITMGMDSLWDRINEPYKKLIDEPEDNESTALMNTGW